MMYLNSLHCFTNFRHWQPFFLEFVGFFNVLRYQVIEQCFGSFFYFPPSFPQLFAIVSQRSGVHPQMGMRSCTRSSNITSSLDSHFKLLVKMVVSVDQYPTEILSRYMWFYCSKLYSWQFGTIVSQIFIFIKNDNNLFECLASKYDIVSILGLSNFRWKDLQRHAYPYVSFTEFSWAGFIVIFIYFLFS